MVNFLSKSEKETQEVAADLALETIKNSASLKIQEASVVILEGELGAGKTTFVKGFAKALGVQVKIKSPTFTLMKKYKIPLLKNVQFPISKQIPNEKFLIHIDCYRVRGHKDMATLDLKSVFKAPENIVLIEWPERISKILPKKLTRIHIDHVDENNRKIRISKNF